MSKDSPRTGAFAKLRKRDEATQPRWGLWKKPVLAPNRFEPSISVTLEGDSSGKRPPVDPDA